MISKEQKRSDFALKQLQAVMEKEQTDTILKDTANFIVGAPTMILQNGLGQTMAFLLSKCDKNEKRQISNKHFFTFNAIAKWSHINNSKIPENPMGFFQAVAGLEQSEYLPLQEEALKMLQWLKRYARAFQKDK